MDKKLSLTAIAASMAVSSMALAGPAENRTVVDAIIAANGGNLPDITFLGSWGGVNGSDTDRYPNGSDFSGNAWTNDAADDECAFAGIICDGSENMTNIELPNAALSITANEFFTALSGVASDLLTINYSNDSTASNENSITGSMPALSAFTNVRMFAVNEAGTSGVVPDMSAMTLLEYVGLNDSAFTDFAGLIGGGNLETLNIDDNGQLVADLTATLASSASSLNRLSAQNSPVTGQIPDYSNNTSLGYFRVEGTGLGGTMNLNGAVSALDDSISGTFNVSGTGIAAGTGTTAATYSPVVIPTTLNTAVGGELVITATWTGVDADAYSVQTSTDGVTWTERASTADVLLANFAMVAGTYQVRVVAYNNGSLNSLSFDIQAVPSNVITDVVVTEVSGGVNPTPVDPTPSSSSGGAAWLLLALPLLARRRRA